jgi:uncharacterized integral membrane protein
MRRHEEDDFGRGNGDSGGSDRSGGRSGGVTVRQILVALAVVTLVVFAVANFKSVQVNFLAFTTQARVVTVILVSAGLGFVIGYFVGRPGADDRKVLRQHREGPD